LAAGCSFDPNLTAAMSAAYRAVLREPTLMAARRDVSIRKRADDFVDRHSRKIYLVEYRPVERRGYAGCGYLHHVEERIEKL
jgi:hypothetical protein